jgi:hypothetical protein
MCKSKSSYRTIFIIVYPHNGNVLFVTAICFAIHVLYFTIICIGIGVVRIWIFVAYFALCICSCFTVRCWIRQLLKSLVLYIRLQILQEQLNDAKGVIRLYLELF